MFMLIQTNIFYIDNMKQMKWEALYIIHQQKNEGKVEKIQKFWKEKREK